jgi:SAM-dependent methyltransferase
MFDTLDACAEAWKRAGNHGAKADRIARNLRWMRYYAQINDPTRPDEAEIDPHAAEVVDLLFRQGLLTPESSVLDIGSGSGTYALAFAARGCEVTAMDMDPNALRILRAHAEQLHLDNVQCVEQMWEDILPEKHYSFVFTSMCPAICDYDELLRMQALSEHACGIVAVTRGSFDRHRKRLMELLDVHPTGGMTTEALWYYEALYLSGKQPNVQSYSAHYEYEIPIEEACRRNEIYFEIFDIPAEASRPSLRDYFASQAKDGMVPDETQLNTALISWRV